MKKSQYTHQQYPDKIAYAIVVCLFMLFAAAASAAELDQRMEKTARKLSEAGAAQGVRASTLAVFPFQADENLSKKRVNFAVSEILTKYLLRQGTFRVTERAQLEEVMKEQKLGLSGAIDSNTAADIGKLLGAKLLVLGNVIQVGRSYQITSKLVNSESGEIISSEIVEVPVKTFDEDAGSYLVLVPEYEAIGLYAAAGYGPARVKKLPPVTRGAITFTPTNQSSNLIYGGVGVRYFLAPKWMADFSIMTSAKYDGNGGKLTAVNGGGQLTGNGFDKMLVRAFAFRILPVSAHFKAQAGAGVTLVGGGSNFEQNGQYMVSGTELSVKTSAKTAALPTLKLGLEWKPKPRFGWSLSGLYYAGKMTGQSKARLSNGQPDVVIRQFDSPAFTVESDVALYF